MLVGCPLITHVHQIVFRVPSIGRTAVTIYLLLSCLAYPAYAGVVKQLDGRKIEFESVIEPSVLKLTCEDQLQSSRQRRDFKISKSVPCRGLACAMERVAEKIAGDEQAAVDNLEQQGFRRKNVNIDGQSYARFDIPFKYQFKARFKVQPGLELDPGDELLGYSRTVLRKVKQAKTFYTPATVESVLTEPLNENITRQFQRWRHQALAEANTVVETLKEHIDFSPAQLQEMSVADRGHVRLTKTVRFCGKSHPVSYRWRWKALGSSSASGSRPRPPAIIWVE